MRSFAIVPAAGHSRRMGRPKLLLPLGDRTLIDHVLCHWIDSDAARVAVVVRPGDNRLADACRAHQVDVIVPRDAPHDMKASVLAGLEHIARAYRPAAQDRWLLAPADMPLLDPDTVNAVIRRSNQCGHHIVVPVRDGRRGHPVSLPWSMAADVKGLREDEGIDTLVRCNQVDELEVGDRGDIFTDVNTPEQYDALCDLQSPRRRKTT